ncbi:hypothetical protein [Thermoactinospora rubra]|uniref:hypothetical protein n=1 Tax=Thermoactinospora rubra TaxID=1088767 RepID=UPI000A108319|nr:hypothetical protein [Thermoactinospora rubra]
MRDPELVSCAQRAAAELERAWAQWRAGMDRDAEAGADPAAGSAASSVASYVAHSLDHPWGRPRVVLGLDADEARELAALLHRQEMGEHV